MKKIKNWLNKKILSLSIKIDTNNNNIFLLERDAIGSNAYSNIQWIHALELENEKIKKREYFYRKIERFIYKVFPY
jgi:hypothetical protein